ncbi:hypothetical protein [Glycomyces tarimensis]
MKFKQPIKKLGTLAAAGAAGIALALTAAAPAQAQSTTTEHLKETHKGLSVNEGDWETGKCGTGDQIPADKPDDADGWVFILPSRSGEAFVSVTATFEDGDGNRFDVDAEIMSTANGTQFKHAYVEAPAGSILVDAVAEVIGGDKGDTFHVTHTCAGEVPDDGSTTTPPSETPSPSDDVTSPGGDATTSVPGDASTTVPGEESTTPAGGVLPTTGAPLTIALVSAAALAAGGAVLFLMMRRRQAAQDW